MAGAKDQSQNRGRLQAQGPDIKEPAPTFPWAQNAPPTKIAAYVGLDAVQAACTEGQRSRRTQAFADARDFISQGPYEPPPPVTRSFFNRNLSRRYRACRVDVEVWKGVAFT